MTDARVSDTLEQILHARHHHEAVSAPSERHSLGVDEAYTLQDRVRKTLVGRGERVIGWKAGFTNKASQQAFGASEPVCGFLLASGVFADGAEVAVSRFVQVVVEAEVAFVIKRDLSGPGVTPEDAIEAVDGARPALELVDFRYRGKPTASDVIADGVYANAIVLGTSMTSVTHMDLALEGLVYELNGEIAATNTAAEVMGGPANSLAWIANHLGTRGLGLRAGDIVMSGSVSLLLRPKAGDSVRARFTRLGTVSARFV
jgi:2-keto-4-pentenoate hydratase